MSVSFDVLDSLYSIRNVEDLKKHWAEDSKRPRTLSYKAVQQLCEYSNCNTWILRGANFAMRYREAVSMGLCHFEDQLWVMPYVRYVESMKDGSWYSERFDDICAAFDAIEELEQNNCRLNKRHCDAMVKLFSAIQGSFSGNEIDLSLYILESPNDIDEFNPWELNPEEPGDWMSLDCDSFDPFSGFMGRCHDNVDADSLNKYVSFWEKSGCILEEIDETSKEYITLCDIAKETLQIMKAELPDFQMTMDEYLKFKEIVHMLNNDALDPIYRLVIIAKEGFPNDYYLKLIYMVEPLFVEFIKDSLKSNLPHRELVRLFREIKSLKDIIPQDLFEYCSKSFFTDSLYEAAIREDERKKVLFEMSHSIKNLVATISDPLTMLQAELNDKQRRIIENALSGTELIRDLAVGVHMSMRGENGAWRKDVQEPGFGATTLDKIILDAMRHAISNMFDGKYFAQFVRNYFGRDLDTFMQAQNDWKAAQTAEQVFDCINKYFFNFKIDCHDTDMKIPVGDRDGTATKLLILFQELFLNAVKYSSFAESDKRFVKVDITITADKWNIEISNSAIDRKNVKSSGIGLAVIKNFAELFEATYNARLDSDVYTATMKFFLNK